MPFPWVIVGGAGYDVEEIDNPRTRDMVCPACDRHVRFVEKQLVKNLRVFGVPLVGIEKGKRVFECPHCRACIEQPAAEPDAEGAAPDTEALRELRARIERLRDEQWLWRGRAELAEKRGETDLAAEALRLAVRAEREAEALDAEIRRARSAPPPPAPPAAERAPTTSTSDASSARGASTTAQVAPPSASPASAATSAPEPPASTPEPAIDDEFAALKAKLARKGSSGDPARAEPPPTARQPPETASTPSAQPESPPRAEAAPASPSAATAPDGTPAATPAASDEADFAALKRRLAERGSAPGTRDDAALDAIRRELSAPPAPDATSAAPSAAAPTAAPPDAAPDDEDNDPAAALKRKLKKK